MNYSEEEKEIIEQVKEELKRVYKINHLSGTYISIDYLKIMLNLIQKQSKIIKHLAAECSICSGRYEYMEIKEIIKHFEKKVVDEDVKD